MKRFLKRRVALWVTVLALAAAPAVTLTTASIAPSNIGGVESISSLSHKNKCAKYKKKSKKKRKCKQDCGVGPGGYGRPNDHPNNRGQCRDW